jgi:hypothetical protein
MTVAFAKVSGANAGSARFVVNHILKPSDTITPRPGTDLEKASAVNQVLCEDEIMKFVDLFTAIFNR